jgi:hypothetical protein
MGVIFSPRDTYADIVRTPRWLGAMVVVIVMSGAVFFAFLSTEVGQNAMIDSQLTAQESMGRQIPDAQIEAMERFAPYFRYVFPLIQAVAIPIITVVMSGLLLAVLNAMLGGQATFKQVIAIVTFASFVPTLQSLVVMPLNYVRETMTSATSLVVFLPMVDGNSFLGMLLGAIDLFRIWWLVSLAIGLGVLYKRRTSPIAWSLLGVYGALVLAFAGIRAAFSGA